MKPLTVAEWNYLAWLLCGIQYPPEGVDIDHLRQVVADNRRLAEQRAIQNDR